MSATLTPGGQAAVTELAQRYGVSGGAVRTLLDAVIRGGGAMAQFSHPELGGNGQWMRGGMTMVGDMFNPGLQATVSGICAELSTLLGSGDVLVQPAAREPGSFGAYGGDWWPAELGRPSTSGGQNDTAYAYFPGPRRLAVRRGSVVALYDTGEHAISGVQQQQGGRGSVSSPASSAVSPLIRCRSSRGRSSTDRHRKARRVCRPWSRPSSGRGSQTQSQFSVPAASATQPPVVSAQPSEPRRNRGLPRQRGRRLLRRRSRRLSLHPTGPSPSAHRHRHPRRPQRRSVPRSKPFRR